VSRRLGERSGSGSNTHIIADLQKLEKDLRAMYNRGLRAVAVCLLHSYTFPRESQSPSPCIPCISYGGHVAVVSPS
jgi:N-methylhydantoinase A/oxoprolinase/acetone carboxylase beta subunit